jgi:hypothetical protein
VNLPNTSVDVVICCACACVGSTKSVKEHNEKIVPIVKANIANCYKCSQFQISHMPKIVNNICFLSLYSCNKSHRFIFKKASYDYRIILL